MEAPDSFNTFDNILEALPPQKQDSIIRSYQYRPLNLNDMRIIDLLPGTAEDEIMVKIRHTTMQDPLDSECIALSYTWGDPKSTKTITCSDNEGQLVVTSECFSALHRLRLPDKSKTLWVDAISLSQLF